MEQQENEEVFADQDPLQEDLYAVVHWLCASCCELPAPWLSNFHRGQVTVAHFDKKPQKKFIQPLMSAFISSPNSSQQQVGAFLHSCSPVT